MATIVIIDDDINLAECLQLILETEGYDVHRAEDGVDGVNLIRHHHPDLVVCDINMPNASGYDVLDTIQHDPATAETPVIFLTGRTDMDDFRKGMVLGAENYLPKPVTASQLVAAIRTCLQKKDMRKKRDADAARRIAIDIALTLTRELRMSPDRMRSMADNVDEHARHSDSAKVLSLSDTLRKNSMSWHRTVGRFIHFFELCAMQQEGTRARVQASTEDLASLVFSEAGRAADEFSRVADLRSHGEARVGMEIRHLEVLVFELATNAFKFSKPGTPVNVHAEVAGGSWILTVADRGCGMGDEEIQSIGMPRRFSHLFFEQRSFGLGLATVQLIAEFYGGKLNIQSDRCHGTTMPVVLPIV